MLELSNIKIFNFEAAIRGMRQPFKNTQKSDSIFGIVSENTYYDIVSDWITDTFFIDSPNEFECVWSYYEQGILNDDEDAIQYALLGPADLDLAQRLAKAGSPHNKFLRQILVSFDINAPLYWWKEMDTYKVGTVANSESTMHTIMKREFQPYDFSFDGSFYHNNELLVQTGMTVLQQQIFLLNTLRKHWLEEENADRKKKIWKTIIQMLPSSYMQKRTWTGDYAILRAQVEQREGHRLTEWTDDYLRPLHALPYAENLIFYRG